MAEDEPLKGNELEIGANMKQLLTLKTIPAKVKNYWFKRTGQSTEKKEKSKLSLSTRNSLLLSIYKEEWAIKIKNYVNIKRFLPFILIIITLFRFIYLNLLIIAYLRFINASSSTPPSAACQCTLFLIYLIFLCRSIIDSLDTQIIPIFTFLSVYYKLIPFKSHHVFFMQFWPLIALFLSYILYGIFFCILLFFIPWILCDDNSIKSTPNIFFQWFIGWKYIIHIFTGQWRIKFVFNWTDWTSFPIIYCNYFIMSYLPYLFLIGLLFGFALIRHILLNLKTIFSKFILKTWKHFKQFYIILIPIIVFRFVYLTCMWSVFFFGKNSMFDSVSSSSVSCDIVLFSVFIIMIFHALFDAVCCPIVGVEFFMYFSKIHNIFNPFLRGGLKTICGKYIIFPDYNMDNDYNQVISDKNEQSDIDIKKHKKNKKNVKQNIKMLSKKLKISFNSCRKCLGRNGLIAVVSLCWCLFKLFLFYFLFGTVFLFLSVGIIWGHCSDSKVQKTPQIIWQWFVAAKYLFHNHWSFSFAFNLKKWNCVETIFLNYITICFVPYFIMCGSIILCKMFYLLYKYLVILTEAFSNICGTEFTLLFIVFLFYRWLYLVFMWYELLFSQSDNEINGMNISCQITLITVFTVIVFRSMFDSLLWIEFFIYTFDIDLWPLFVIGLLWPVLKLMLSYLILAILSIFFFFIFGFINCPDSNYYFSLLWQWFIAPQYLPNLFSFDYNYLFHKQHWKSVEILYLNYTITAYVPIILLLFIYFIYYLCHYKKINNSIMFTLFRKRIQLILTMLLSYNGLISFIIYMFYTSKMNIMFTIISGSVIGVIPVLIFYTFHKYFTLSISYYKSILSYWFLKIIDWNSTFILFASVVYKYGNGQIVWNESLTQLKNKNRNKQCDPNVYYYWYFRAIHTMIKLIFLSMSVLLYCIELLFKLIILTIYLILRCVHYWIVIWLMYYGKLAQMELFIRHYCQYCVGIKFSYNNSDSSASLSNNTTSTESNDSNHSLNKITPEINNYYLFNLSLFIEVAFQSLFILIIVITNTFINLNMEFLNITTIWTVSASLLVIVNGCLNISSQRKNKIGLKETLNDHIFGADKTHNIQYGLITSEIGDACVVLGDVVQY